MATKAKKTVRAVEAPADSSNVTDISTARKRGKKPASDKRVSAQAAYEAAKEGNSEAAKLAALQQLKIVRFREVVVPRVQGALKRLDQIQKMANRAVYSWTPDEASKVITALEDAVALIHSRFTSQGAKEEKEKFSL